MAAEVKRLLLMKQGIRGCGAVSIPYGDEAGVSVLRQHRLLYWLKVRLLIILAKNIQLLQRQMD